MTTDIVDISYDNAQRYLIDESMNRPVVVDFWADWCAPCKALMPVLEKLANEYRGDFLLAKVNADEMGEIAGQFGVRSLPTVVMMVQGRPVDAFQGAQPEGEVRKFLDKHLPKPWERKVARAGELIAEGALDEARTVLREAYMESSQQAEVALALARVCLDAGHLDEGRAVLEGVEPRDRDEVYTELMAALELKEASAKTPEILELEERLNRNPDNLELAYELAVQFSQNNHHKDALELLYRVLRSDRNFRDGGARKIYLDILAVLGKGNPVAIEYQRKIYTLLY